nr:unnamed protein product [Digitaria exilis]
MAKTGKGSAAAAKPPGGGGNNGEGSGRGNVHRDSGKRPGPAPSASPEASPTNRGKAVAKDEASKPEEAAAAAAMAGIASRRPEMNVTGKPLPQKPPQPWRPWASETTKEILLSCASMHFEKKFRKSLQNISSLNQRILLSGPSGSEIYQETLIKALAKHFDARLLILDSLTLGVETSSKDARMDDAPCGSSDIEGISNLNTFKEGDRVEYIGNLLKLVPRYGNDLGGLCDTNRGFYCHASELRPDSSGVVEVDSVALGKLLEADSHSDQAPIRGNPRVLNAGQEPLGIGFHGIRRCAAKSTAHLKNLFPNNICIQLPQNEAQLLNLKKQLEDDTENLKAKTNVLNIRKFLASREIECNDLQELSIKDRLLTNENVDKIVGSAVSHHLQHNKSPNDGKMILPIESVMDTASSMDSDVVTENEFEQKVLSNVISPNETGVTFEDIGALDNVKETMGELVMLPLRRPELFSKGQLRKPVKGILLFGPPGTGKTMLAKAIATEAGANFINVSMSIITSKMLGESEKYVKAVFSLASKISPAVIFVDEVDSMLSNRGSPGEHEEMRKIKNEFMVNWDGLRTKEQERVLVLGATNRPYDLDDAVVRRFPRRIMVSLPDASNREKILKVLLSKETLAPDVDLELVAKMTEGYSGSDLKNICVTAAHCPIREMIEEEKKEKSLAIAEGKPEPPLRGRGVIRPLGMGDLKFALGQVK